MAHSCNSKVVTMKKHMLHEIKAVVRVFLNLNSIIVVMS